MSEQKVPSVEETVRAILSTRTIVGGRDYVTDHSERAEDILSSYTEQVVRAAQEPLLDALHRIAALKPEKWGRDWQTQELAQAIAIAAIAITTAEGK